MDIKTYEPRINPGPGFCNSFTIQRVWGGVRRPEFSEEIFFSDKLPISGWTRLASHPASSLPALDESTTTRGAWSWAGSRIAGKDAMGLWFEAQLDQAAEYAALIKGSYRGGRDGLFNRVRSPSSSNSSGRAVKTWPIFELSLTPTPVDPRTIGVETAILWRYLCRRLAETRWVAAYTIATDYRKPILPSPRVTLPAPRETTKRQRSWRQSPG